MRSPIEKLEEWLFKLTRASPFDVVPEATDEATRFKQGVQMLACPSCSQKKLKVNKFERGPKGWEVDISCGNNCGFGAIINSKSTIMLGVSGRSVTE